MSMILLRAGALSCALLASTAITPPAIAQTARAFRNLDANGVDLTHGDFLPAISEGSIGSGEGEIELIRDGVWLGSGINVNGHQWDRISFRQIHHGGTSFTRTVTIGSRFEVFNSLGSLPSGSSLSASSIGYNFIYRSADGTTIEFTDPTAGWGTDSNFCTGWTGQGDCSLLPTTISQPDGKTVNLVWETEPDCWGLVDSENMPCHFTARLTSVANSLGYGIQFAYSSGSWSQRTGATFHNGTVSGNPAQGSVSYSYPSAGVTEVTDMGGNVWRLTGTTAGITAIRRPGASSDTTTITGTPNAVTSVTRDGVTTNYSRSVSGSTATMTVTDALSHSSTVVSNLTVGRPTSVTDALSNTTAYQYDSYGRMTRVTAPEGNYVQYTYDGRGNVTETRRVAKSGSSLADIVTSATYASTCADPSCNQPLTTTDANGNVTDYTYDTTHGGLLSVTGPAPTSGVNRPQTRYSYTLTNGEYQLTAVSACSSGTVASSCVDTADESRTVAAYDANGNVTSVERRSGNTSGTGALTAPTAMTYDALGNLLTVDGPLTGTADTTRFRYNAGRQRIGAVGPDPDGTGSLHHRAQRITYTNGLPTKAETGTVNSQSDGDWASFSTLEEARQEYDSNARPFVQRLVSGSTTYALTQTSYDALGRPQCIAQRMNTSEFATSALPSDACTLDTQGSYGPDRIVQSLYDDAGQLLRTRTAVGTALERDVVIRGYTANGQLSHVIDGENNLTDYVHDGHDRLEYTLFPSATQGALTASMTNYEQLAYDPAGNVVSRRLRDATSIGYSYDALNRLTLKNLPGSELDVTYAYDLLNHLTSAVTSSQTLSFTYDALGRNLTQTGPLGTVSSAYDLAGRRYRLAYPGTGLYVDYEYLVTGEVTVIRENGASSGLGVLGTYTYDDRGRRTSLTLGNGRTATYAYDNVSRLTQIANDLSGSGNDLTLNMSHSPSNQIASREGAHGGYAWTSHYGVSRNHTANGLNQYSAIADITPTYDTRGNLTSTGSITYGYSSENSLTSATGMTFSYDPLLRLYQTVGAATTRLLYDGHNLIGEYDASSDLMRRYVHGPGTDEPLVWYEGSGTSTRRFYHTDERGSVTSISGDNGVPVSFAAYDDYGIPQPGGAAWPVVYGRFGYTGQAWIPELGMYYYRARIYSPTLGRFMQTDPIGFGGGMNLYAYVGNDPVNFTDPLGLCPPGQIEVFDVSGPSSGSGNNTTVTARRLCVDMPTYASHGGGGIGRIGGIDGIDGGGGAGSAGSEPLAKRIRCAIGRAGVLAEQGGETITQTGEMIALGGAGLMGVSFLSGIEAGVPFGGLVVLRGLQIMSVGGTIALTGSVMRGVGTGDYSGTMIRGVNRYVSSRIIARPFSTIASRAANRSAGELLNRQGGRCG